jgi:hypothetical protein
MKASTIAIILLALALGIALFFLGRSNGKQTITNVTNVYDSIPTNNYYPTNVINEKGGFRHDSIVRLVPADVDTAAILAMYYTAHRYEQTIRDAAAEVEATITDTITENRLLSRQVRFKNLRPTLVVPPMEKPPVLQLYAGMFYNFQGAGPEAMVTFRNFGYAGAGWDLIRRKPEVRAGLRIKIKK